MSLFAASAYSVSQQWAEALFEVGHAAILYTSKFAPGGTALAVFGDAGPQPQPTHGWSTLTDLLGSLGVVVAPIPALSQLVIEDPH